MEKDDRREEEKRIINRNKLSYQDYLYTCELAFYRFPIVKITIVQLQYLPFHQ